MYRRHSQSENGRRSLYGKALALSIKGGSPGQVIQIISYHRARRVPRGQFVCRQEWINVGAAQYVVLHRPIRFAGDSQSPLHAADAHITQAVDGLNEELGFGAAGRDSIMPVGGKVRIAPGGGMDDDLDRAAQALNARAEVFD